MCGVYVQYGNVTSVAVCVVPRLLLCVALLAEDTADVVVDFVCGDRGVDRLPLLVRLEDAGDAMHQYRHTVVP